MGQAGLADGWTTVDGWVVLLTQAQSPEGGEGAGVVKLFARVSEVLDEIDR